MTVDGVLAALFVGFRDQTIHLHSALSIDGMYVGLLHMGKVAQGPSKAISSMLSMIVYNRSSVIISFSDGSSGLFKPQLHLQ